MTTLEKVQPLATYQVSRVTRPGTVSQAVIMAGGKGTRLHPYSALLPKPLMPLGDMPILELLLRQMQQAGITDVLVAVNHLRHLIEAFFGDGSQVGLRHPLLRARTSRSAPRARSATCSTISMRPSMVSNGDLLTSMDIDGHGTAAFRDRCRRLDRRVPAREQDRFRPDRVRRGEPAAAPIARSRRTCYYVSMGIYILQREAIRPHDHARRIPRHALASAGAARGRSRRALLPR